MKNLLISATLSFLVTLMAFELVADGETFWNPSAGVVVDEKAGASVSIMNEPSVQGSSVKAESHEKVGEAVKEQTVAAVDQKKERVPQSTETKKAKDVFKKVGAEEASKAENVEKVVKAEKTETATSPVETGVDATKKYSVQIGSFKTDGEAKEKVTVLEKSGFPTFVQEATVQGTQYFRVKVGPVASRAEAETLREKVAKLPGFSDAMVKKAR